jgi:oligosaccharyltransferase complex subunit beta
VWIGGIWITVAGWLAFVALWLYSAPTERSVKKTQ